MSGYNNSLLYFKKYYENIDWHAASDSDQNKAKFTEKNKKLHQSEFPSGALFSYQNGLDAIELQTTYPGLLLGSGIAHGSGLLGEMKLGFFLDYTTGLPVIPGSSVKGVLRSAFPQGYQKAAKKRKENDNEKALLEEKAKQTLAYVQYYLEKISGKPWGKEAVDELETFLFGSYETGSSDLSMSGRTVFHDAIPFQAEGMTVNGTRKKYYLGDDYITPHKNRKGNGIPDALVNPTPISFLKVLPGVTFRFQFVFQPFTTKDGLFALSKKETKQLFQAILTDFGIGAKTNVGYGRLIDPTAVEIVRQTPRADEQRSGQPPAGSQTSKENTSPDVPKPPPARLHIDRINRRGGVDVKGVLEKIEGREALIRLDIDGWDQLVKTSLRNLGSESIGKTFLMTIQSKDGRAPNWKLNIVFKSVLPYTGD